MSRNRLEAFSDGVLAIIITIMVLELKTPTGENWTALVPLVPVFLSYLLSFLYVGIYWNNHHHMFHAVRRVTGGVLWANLHLLFWLSLLPFATRWLGEHHTDTLPSTLYGVILLLAAISYFILQNVIIADQGADSLLKRAVGQDWKGKTSLALYVVGILVSFGAPLLAQLFYAAVALMWFIPDRRIEQALQEKE